MDSSSLTSHVQSFVLASPGLFIGVIMFSLVGIIRYFVIYRSRRLYFPVVGNAVDSELKNDMMEGARKYPEEPFIIPVSPPVVVLPECVLDEIRFLSEDKVSFLEVVKQEFIYKHTSIGDQRPEVITAVKTDLTRNISTVLDTLQDEVKYALDKEVGACTEWKPIYLFKAITNIVALMSGRTFVGLPLSREDDWLDVTINFTVDAVAAARALKRWNPLLRPFAAPFLEELRRVRKHKARGAEMLAPYMEQKLLEVEMDEKKKPGEEEQSAFTGWVLKYTKDHERRDPAVLALNQVVLSFAAIHTSGMAATHCLFDLAARPEYIKPLREEIEQVIAEDGYDVTGDGTMKLKKSSLPRLRKLDSFMKESQRHAPAGLFGNTRVVLQPLTLSTGHTIPVGTRIAFNLWGSQMSTKSQTFSPSYNPPTNKSPTEFDGFRFANLRAMEGKENKHQFVSTSPDSLSFGHGNHACPGRFFASNEIKLILIEVLRTYDIRLKGDVELKGGADKRPKDGFNAGAIFPNPYAQIEFKLREVEKS